jgi:hypothetical protein
MRLPHNTAQVDDPVLEKHRGQRMFELILECKLNWIIDTTNRIEAWAAALILTRNSGWNYMMNWMVIPSGAEHSRVCRIMEIRHGF